MCFCILKDHITEIPQIRFYFTKWLWIPLEQRDKKDLVCLSFSEQNFCSQSMLDSRIFLEWYVCRRMDLKGFCLEHWESRFLIMWWHSCALLLKLLEPGKRDNKEKEILIWPLHRRTNDMMANNLISSADLIIYHRFLEEEQKRSLGRKMYF